MAKMDAAVGIEPSLTSWVDAVVEVAVVVASVDSSLLMLFAASGCATRVDLT